MEEDDDDDDENSCNIMYPRNIVCFRYKTANTLHEGDKKKSNAVMGKQMVDNLQLNKVSFILQAKATVYLTSIEFYMEDCVPRGLVN